MPAQPPDNVSVVLSALPELAPRLDTAALGVYVEELFRWNPGLGLVSKRETTAVVVRLIRRSVQLWDFVRDGLGETRFAGVRRIMDIGSGGGFPGLVWRMLSPEREILLVERKDRKVAFLEGVIVRAKLVGITALAADLRDAARRPEHQHAYDLAVMMAVVDPRRVAGPIEAVLRAPGYFCTTRGREQEFPGESIGRQLRLSARSGTQGGHFLLYAGSSGREAAEPDSPR